MLRVATAASQQLMVSRILDMQRQVNTLQAQSSTQEVSQDFTGIATKSLTLIGFQNESRAATSYIDNNNLAIQKLKAQTTVTNNIQKSVSDMRSSLLDFRNVNLGIVSPDNTLAINNIQNVAFNIAKDMASQLNSKFVGGYMFAGGKVDTQPVNFPFQSVADFQAKFSGSGANYPNTRAQQIGSIAVAMATTGPTNPSMLSFNTNGTITASRLDANQFGDLSFDPGGTITASNATAFNGLVAGSQFTVKGSNGNNQSYTVTANSGAALTVTPPPVALEAASTTSVMSFGTASTQYGNLTYNPVLAQIEASTAGAFTGMPIGATFTMSGAANATNNQVYTVTANDGKVLTVSPPPGSVEMQTASGIITPNVFENYPIGAKIKVAGSGTTNNDVTYTVTGNNGSVLTVTPRPSVSVTTTSITTTITADQPNSYYNGDQLELQHRIDSNRSIALGINASDPGFEKAFRALGIIAQGDLQNHPARVQQAIDLLTDALAHDARKNPSELPGGLSSIQQVLGRNAVLLDNANSQHNSYRGFLDVHASSILHIDPTVTVTQLNLTTLALEISMKAVAQVSKLSLANYI